MSYGDINIDENDNNNNIADNDYDHLRPARNGGSKEERRTNDLKINLLNQNPGHALSILKFELIIDAQDLHKAPIRSSQIVK